MQPPRLDYMNSQQWPPGTFGAEREAAARAVALAHAEVLCALERSWVGRLVVWLSRRRLVQLLGRRWG